jgi:hypothetical protein
MKGKLLSSWGGDEARNVMKEKLLSLWGGDEARICEENEKVDLMRR